MTSKQERIALGLALSTWLVYFATEWYHQHVHETRWLPSPTERLVLVSIITQAALVAIWSIYLAVRNAKQHRFSVITLAVVAMAVGYCIWSLPIAFLYLKVALAS